MWSTCSVRGAGGVERHQCRRRHQSTPRSPWLHSCRRDRRTGKDRVCCGSDYPFPLGELIGGTKYAAGKIIDDSDLDDETKERMLVRERDGLGMREGGAVGDWEAPGSSPAPSLTTQSTNALEWLGIPRERFLIRDSASSTADSTETKSPEA